MSEPKQWQGQRRKGSTTTAYERWLQQIFTAKYSPSHLCIHTTAYALRVALFRTSERCFEIIAPKRTARRSLPAGREGCAPPTTTSVRPLHRLLPPCASARSRAAARSCCAAARSPRALLSPRVLYLAISMAATQQKVFGAASPQFFPLESLSGSCGSRVPFRRPILGYRFYSPHESEMDRIDV